MGAELLLSIIVSLDGFLACMSYGAQRIRISPLSAWILSAVSAAVLAAALALTGWVTTFLPGALCLRISGALLLSLGVVNLFSSLIKAALRRAQGDKRIHFSCCKMNFVLEVFLDETKADCDASQSISAKEAVWLALAFSFDALACGLGAGFSGLSPLRTGLLSLAFGLLSIVLGTRIGMRIGSCKRDFSPLGGLGLMALGALNLFR